MCATPHGWNKPADDRRNGPFISAASPSGKSHYEGRSGVAVLPLVAGDYVKAICAHSAARPSLLIRAFSQIPAAARRLTFPGDSRLKIQWRFSAAFLGCGHE